MKIKTKRFLIAVCLLLVSATMLGTASFAWFSMNTEVSVDGIEVEAYSDALFLEIANTNSDSAFDVTTSISSAKKSLRLVTNGEIDPAKVVKLSFSAASGTYASGNYYVKADSDVTDTALDSNDGKDNYILATDLVASSDVEGLYVIEFQRVDAEKKYAATTDATAVFYAKDAANQAYVQVDNATLVEGQSLAAYYTTVADPAEQTAGATYEVANDYYEKSGATLATYTLKSDLEPGSSLDGYFAITEYAHDADTSLVAGVADYYYIKNEVDTGKYEYSCLGYDISADLDTYSDLYWGRAYSNALGDHQATNTLNIIHAEDTNYFRHDTVYLRCAENTNDGTNLKIAEVKIGGRVNALSEALRILFVATNEKGETVYVRYENRTKTIDNGALFATILGNKGEVVTVDMYVYFDGTDEAAKTVKDGDAGLLNGQTVEVKFTIDKPDYNN